jgi:hypothetical protein
LCVGHEGGEEEVVGVAVVRLRHHEGLVILEGGRKRGREGRREGGREGGRI